MFSLRQLAALLVVLFAMFCILEARNMPYEAEALYPGYRFDGWAEAPMHKRVPSAGDMMVRFGKRSE
ncbi:hypothetical protein WR25_04115 [Diploscapter pachys]|uniref:Uncharacterized protein n=1 Tax=Diploscapter pachys TaxID=2018661 RepID=A0A2A2J295_9BILA|nr:hypothetical protein WR25_04115 [Diploscapter pachys]